MFIVIYQDTLLFLLNLNQYPIDNNLLICYPLVLLKHIRISMKKERVSSSIKNRILITSAITIIVLAGVLFVFFTIKQIDKQKRDNFLQRGLLVASAINKNDFSELIGAEEYLLSPYYKRQKEQLSAMRLCTPKILPLLHSCPI